MRILRLFTLSSMVVFATSCNGSSEKSATSQVAVQENNVTQEVVNLQASKPSAPAKVDTTFIVNGTEVGVPNGVYAFFRTTNGDILVRLFYKATPMTVGNFVSLAEGTNEFTKKKAGQPFYNDLIFHRVIPNFMIQGGDPAMNGSGGPGYAFPDEFVDTLRHSHGGILSMANSGPGTNGSQFFITEVATPHLDDRHTVFGEVAGGNDIVPAIARVPRGQADRPNTPVVMESVEIYRIGEEARKFKGFPEFVETKMALLEKIEQERIAQEERKARWPIASAKFSKEMMAILEDWYDDNGLNTEDFKEEYIEWREDDMETTASGLGYIVIDEGDGEQVALGEKVGVDYVGYLTSGKIFDSSLEDVAMLANVYNAQRQYGPLPLMAGRDRVIQGWNEGIPMFKKGSHVRLIIPAKLGYGSQAMGNVIPANSTLIFDLYIHE